MCLQQTPRDVKERFKSIHQSAENTAGMFLVCYHQNKGATLNKEHLVKTLQKY